MLFLSLVSIILLTYKDYGTIWNEDVFVNSGHYYTRLILNYFKIKNNLAPFDFFKTYPALGLVHIQTHGVSFDILLFSLMSLFKKFSFENYHLLKALVAVPTFIFIYLTVRKLTNWKVAAFSFLLLGLFPDFYGNIFNNAIDVQSVLVLSAAVCSFTYFFLGKQTVFKGFVLAFFLGLCLEQRIIFLYVFLLILLGIFVREWLIKKKFVSAFYKSFLLGFFSLIFAHLLHPYLFTHPIFGLFDMMKAARLYPFTAANLFEGKMYFPPNLPWNYLPKLIFITTPEATIFLFIIGNFYLLKQIFTKKTLGKNRFIFFFLLSIMYVPIILTILLKPNIYDSWRQFLFLTVPIIIIAAFGFLTIIKLKTYWLKVCLMLLIAADLLFTAYTFIKLHPYQYVYYNLFVGGLKGAYRQYETDYLGAGYKEAVLWFNSHINDPTKTYLIYAEGDRLSSQTYFKKNMVFTSDVAKADYIFTFTRWNLDRQNPGKTVYTVEREGVPLIFIKQNIHG